MIAEVLSLETFTVANISWTPVIQTAISGLAVLIASIALFNTMRQSKAQREDLERTHKEAQSRSVDLWVQSDDVAESVDSFWRTIEIQISNSSAYPIRDVLFEFRTLDEVNRNDPRFETSITNVVPPTPIGAYFGWRYEMSIDRSIWAEHVYGAGEPCEIAITFLDSNTARWRRYADGRIEEVAPTN